MTLEPLKVIGRDAKILITDLQRRTVVVGANDSDDIVEGDSESEDVVEDDSDSDFTEDVSSELQDMTIDDYHILPLAEYLSHEERPAKRARSDSVSD